MQGEGVAMRHLDDWLAKPYEEQRDGECCGCGAYLRADGQCSEPSCPDATWATACKGCGRWGDWEEYAGHCPECGENLIQEVRGLVPGEGGGL